MDSDTNLTSSMAAALSMVDGFVFPQSVVALTQTSGRAMEGFACTIEARMVRGVEASLLASMFEII